MNLRARTFFSYYREGNKLQAKEYREQLRISRTPAMIDKYYNALDNYYTTIIEPERSPEKLPPEPIRPARDMTTTATRNEIIQMFSRARMRGRLTPNGR